MSEDFSWIKPHETSLKHIKHRNSLQTPEKLIKYIFRNDARLPRHQIVDQAQMVLGFTEKQELDLPSGYD